MRAKKYLKRILLVVLILLIGAFTWLSFKVSKLALSGSADLGKGGINPSGPKSLGSATEGTGIELTLVLMPELGSGENIGEDGSEAKWKGKASNPDEDTEDCEYVDNPCIIRLLGGSKSNSGCECE